MKPFSSEEVLAAIQLAPHAHSKRPITRITKWMLALCVVFVASLIGQITFAKTWEDLVAHARKGHTGALSSIEARAAQGDPIAQVFLGRHFWGYENNYNLGAWSGERHEISKRWDRYYDNSIALKWLYQAADANYAGAQYLLGVYHLNKSNDTVASSYLRKAADQGFAEAQYQLAYLYESGIGVPRDLAAYETWLRRAAGQDHLMAHYHLGQYYVSGDEKQRQRLIRGYFHMARAATISGVEDVGGTDSAAMAATEWEPHLRITRSEFDTVKSLLKTWRFKPPPSHAGHVREVQELLTRMGYLTCAIDGIWGYCTMRSYYGYLEDIGAVPGWAYYNRKKPDSSTFYSFTRESLNALRESARLAR